MFNFRLIMKLKCGTNNRGLGPDTCFLGSHMLVKFVMTVGCLWVEGIWLGVGVSMFDFKLILILSCGTHERGLGPDTCFLGSHILVKFVMTVRLTMS
jgi:hypothetical protein